MGNSPRNVGGNSVPCENIRSQGHAASLRDSRFRPPAAIAAQSEQTVSFQITDDFMTNPPCCEESELLTTLWEIRAWAARDEEPIRNLTNIACLVGNRFFCDVCSIYKVDALAEEIVLAATVGLKQDCVGKLRLKLGEGLSGQVAATGEPLMVEDEAMQHPQFKYFPEAGEEPYESFLGVPIGWKSQLEGVLVVQTIEAREYTSAEIRMLSLAADLMAPAVRNLPFNVLKPGKAKTAGKA
jgi:signal transduction protein with GAF and PtsI domain